MALVRRIAHLSKLAFFLSLGVAATIVDACGGEEDDGTGGKQSKGGASSAGQAGGNATGGLRATGGSAQTASGGTTANGGATATGGTTGIVVDAGSPPKDADLWDVICE